MAYSIFQDTMSDMSFTDIQASIDKGAIVLLPTGVIEQQGPHLPTASDIYVSHLICRKIKDQLQEDDIECLIAPPFYWGVNHITGAFPGSFTSRKETVKNVLFDIFECLSRWGVKKVFIVDIHGDPMNGAALYESIVAGRDNLGLDVRSVISHWIAEDLGIHLENENFLIYNVEMTPEDLPAPKQYLDIHAGEGSTAQMVKFFPDLVKSEVALKLEPTNLKYEDLKKWHQGGETARNITPLGYFGAPADFEMEDVDNLNLIDGISKFATIRLKEYLKR
ncbi:creatininase family protein [Paenibacillus sp. GCM10028914]|uniref:creatininase family protein n=1 Tax=Paenibacillus sp. GCM10028914 TaxID=3273416 RepID=UPI00361B8F34